jgi:N4-gp56 family major capsid protein
MKTLEELAKMTTGDITAILPKIIISEVEEAARAHRFGRALVRINSDLVGKQGRSIHVPKRTIMSAAHIGEGTALNAFTGGTSPAYTTVEITPTKVVSYAALTQEALDASEFDLIRDHIREAGEALADLEDADIVNEFLGSTAVSLESHAGTAAHGVTTLAHARIIQVTACVRHDTGVALTVEAVDYFDGKVKIAENLLGVTTTDTTYTYTANAAGTGTKGAVDVNTAGQLKYEDITAMGTLIRSAKRSPNFMVLNPEEMADLIKDNRFIDAAAYGSAEPLLTGEVGKVGAMKLLTTTNIPAGVVFCVDSTRAAYLVIKRNVDLKRWDNPQTDAVELYFYFEYAPKVVNGECIAIVYGCESNADESL